MTRSAVGAGDDRSGDSDRFGLDARSAQDVQRAEGFDLFKAFCQKQIDHVSSSLFRVQPIVRPM